MQTGAYDPSHGLSFEGPSTDGLYTYSIAARIVEVIEMKQRQFRSVAQMEEGEANEILRIVVASALQSEALDGRLHVGPDPSDYNPSE